ncbi:MAG: hypothetical protein EOO10_14145 [Chitinophagaceae bacterium]|nr:MAG: hypothetical protein EOO10_14145 [Chitinophagaceae bacterium]
MLRTVLVFAMLSGLIACKNNDRKAEAKKEETEAGGITAMFKEAALPYQLADTSLQKNTDTTSLPAASIAPLISDSIKNNYFGIGAKIKFTPLTKFNTKAETYYVVKASTASKKGALVMVYDKDNKFAASYPFLLPDADPSTSQASIIDKNLTITKTISQRNGPDVTGEGKEVVAYDATQKAFSLIMLDVLNEELTEIISPIDTFAKTHKLAGDYRINKKNIVSIRDGRYPNQLLVYIHTEDKSGECKGELRGEFIMTSSTTAVYRQGGDPCVLNLTFSGNSVSLNEEKGCGNYRGLDCPLSGTFTRKKPQSAKQTSDKPKRK